MPRIWIISEYYYPVVVTTGYYVTEIAEFLAQKGVDINVLSSNNRYYDSDKSSMLKEEEHNGVRIFRSIQRQIPKDKNCARIIRFVSLSFSFLWMALKKIKKGDIVIVLTNPAFFLLLMPLVKRLKKCKYHLLVHDIFPENLVSIGKNRNHGIAFRYIKKVFDKAYSKADSCIAIGHDMAAVLEAKVHGKTKIEIIPNWSDTDSVYPYSKEKTKTFSSVLDFAGKGIIFQFAGNLGRAQGLDNLLLAIEKIQNPDAKFMFVGSGAKLKEIDDFAKKHDAVVSLGFIPRSEQNDFLNACDIGIVTLADGMYGLGVPSKSYNIMAAGRPILYIGERDSEIALCIKKYSIGWIVEPNNPDALANQIELILKERRTITEMGIRAREVAVTIFGKKLILEQYLQYIIN